MASFSVLWPRLLQGCTQPSAALCCRAITGTHHLCGDHLANRYGGRRCWRRGVADMQHATYLLQEEVMDERAVTPHRLRPDTRLTLNLKSDGLIWALFGASSEARLGHGLRSEKP